MLLQAQDLEKSFGEGTLFEKISFMIDDHERIALVGDNGVGKSTLLRLLVGEESPTKGEVHIKKDIHISYLAQASRFSSDKTVYEEMRHVFLPLIQQEKALRQMEKEMARLSGEALSRLMHQYDAASESFRQAGGFSYESRIQTVLTGFRFDKTMWETRISDLSGGQNTRLALARMLLQEPDLLLLDEPTNHLDMETVSWLEQYLARYKGALLIVSHDRYFLDKIANRTLDLTNTGMISYAGNYSFFAEQKALSQAKAKKAFDKQVKEIQKMETFIERNIARASTTKRAKSRQKQLDKLEPIEAPLLSKPSANMHFPIEKRSGQEVIQVSDVTIGYDGQALTRPLSLDVRFQDAIAIIGPNGVGKSTFLKSLVGERPFITGDSQLGANVSIGYYDQNQGRLTPTNTVLDELWNDFPTTSELEIRNHLASFLFTGEEVKKTVAMLSGGEKARLLLAKLAKEKHNLLILDEPTNHLDMMSKEILEEALINYEGTIVFVSHDRYFINRIANRIFEISSDSNYMYLGNYDDYLVAQSKLSEISDKSLPTSDVVSAKVDYQSQKLDQKEERKKQRRVQEIEEAITDLEEFIKQLQADMQETNDIVQLSSMQERLETSEEKLGKLITEWETLA